MDIPPVERVARMLAKGYLYGSHFLPHDAMQTQKSGRTFLNELKDAGLVNCKAVPRTLDIWVGISRLKQMLPRFSFRLPHCERGIEMLCNYHTIRETSTGIARDEPVHDQHSHASDVIRLIAEAESAGMLSSAGSTANLHRRPLIVKTGFRRKLRDDFEPDILDRFFGETRRRLRVIR
jgi:hypothetical protein